MSNDNLVLQVRWITPWYHGDGDWPPAPFRLFQALMDGGARGDIVPAASLAVLEQLEGLCPPEILAPSAQRFSKRRTWVPNNDLDSVKGQVSEIAKLRTAKDVAPLLIPQDASVWYRWNSASSVDKTAANALAKQLYRLGRGADMAWACATWLSDDEWSSLLDENRRHLHFQPCESSTGATKIRTATPGSAARLVERYSAWGAQFVGKRGVRLAPPALFSVASYNAAVDHIFLTLNCAKNCSLSASVNEHYTSALVTQIRDKLAERLASCVSLVTLNQQLIGRDSTELDKQCRIRITPLPSTGQQHVRGIRRILIERPNRCSIPMNDLTWAANGLNLPAFERHWGELILLTAEQDKVFKRYGLGDDQSSTLWQTITPAVLPGLRANASPTEADNVLNRALKQAGIHTPARLLRMQRPPFHSNETPSGDFSPGTRFRANDLWHLEVAFEQSLSGPILVGNGRYLGLGLLRRYKHAETQVFCFEKNAPPANQRSVFLSALRRALMARERQAFGKLSVLFSGHETDGSVTRRGHHAHAFLCAEEHGGNLKKVLVAPPWVADLNTSADDSLSDRLVRCCAELNYVNAGHLGKISLRLDASGDTETLSSGFEWQSLTPYHSTTYPKKHQKIEDLIHNDIRTSCARRGLPLPKLLAIEPQRAKGRPAAKVRICFPTAINGPLLIGGNCHLGGGHFVPVSEVT